MGMGIDKISNSSLLSQLEVMNKQMSAMSQGANATPVIQNGSVGFAYNAPQNSPYFTGTSAAAALSEYDNVSRSKNPMPELKDVPLTQTTSAGQSVGEFKQLLKDAFENVNVLQNTSSEMQSRFDVGDRSITLADVMIASQKSSLSFEATLQIRNKIVDAYQSIMQMQI